MKLPPLNALRAFDAAARTGSVRLAAEEMFVTPAAVSQQIRHLEEHLGVSLFERRARGLLLTDQGRTLHQGTTRHLRAIAMAASQVAQRKHTVTVSTVQSFAVRWLVPRLPNFTAANPNTEVRVDANPALLDPQNGDFELGIREGGGRYRGAESRHLLDLNVIPVTTPAYAAQVFGRRKPGWPEARLLHESYYTWWPQWFEMAGITGIDTAKGLYFSHTMLALASAMQGQGIALTPRYFVEEELDDKRLVIVDARELVTGIGYWIAWPHGQGRTLSPAATAFRDWVIAEADKQRAASPG